MEVDEIIKDIFGLNVYLGLIDANSTEESSKGSRVPHGFTLVNNYIETTLSKNALTQNVEDIRVGRIGPSTVKFDKSTYQGPCLISPDRLGIHSLSNFSTIRANTAVYKGKWMYELELGSNGVMQVGWSTIKCEFNQKCGVGDTINSYAYDGNRIRKWNVTIHKYGEAWLTGDIIGCAIDMDNGTIDFYRNGRHLGRAFENISMGPGFAYFPTVSLVLSEKLTANFGSMPMRYPIEGYEPLQAAPEKEIIQATQLFKWLSRIMELINAQQNMDEQKMLHNENISFEVFLMCLSRSVLKHLGSLITLPYITAHISVPFLQRLSELKTDSSKESMYSCMLFTCLDLLWTFLEDHEMKAFLESTLLCLLSAFRHVTSLSEYLDHCKSLLLLTKICKHTTTRQYLLQYLLFDRVRFVDFMHVKPMDEGGLADVVSKVWWEMNSVDSTIEANKACYLDTCEKIRAAVSEVEEVQVELLLTLLDNSDGNDKRPTSRTIFLRRFKRFVQDNLELSRTPLPITLCCFHRLLVAFRILWNIEVGTSPVYMPCRAFYDASVDYSRTERLGGVLSHLSKTFRSDLLEQLGPDHEVITALEQSSSDSSNAHNRTTRVVDLRALSPGLVRAIHVSSSIQANSVIYERLGYLREDRSSMPLGLVDATVSLLRMLDTIILFYHIVAKKQLASVANFRNRMSEFITAMQETKGRLEQIKKKKDFESQSIQQELSRTINVFNTKLIEQARYMAWVRAVVYSEQKQSQLAWLLGVVTFTLKNSSKEGNLFSFVPDFFLEALADLFVSLRNHMHPTVRIENIPDYREMLSDIAEFLCEHFMDPRIVNANSKSTLLLTLAGFVCNSLTLEILENVPEESRIKVVINLLNSYENRAWAESNWILVRFWQGNGFAFRHKESIYLSKRVGPRLLQHESISQPIRPCPSTVYQDHIKDILLRNPQISTKFLNSLLNQLNWALSEFIGMIQEIHNVSSRPERVFIDSRQLKICATCFDLTISLLRVLEMITTVVPSIFIDSTQSSSENLLSRLCQLLCQVLNRISLPTSCFQHVVLLEIPNLESVDHFPILAAITGILLALLKEDMTDYKLKKLTEVPKVTQTLLMEPSFQMSSLHFLLGDTMPKSKMEQNAKTFSFANYPDCVMKEELKKVKDMIEYLDECRAILPELKILSDDDDTCTICYAYPVAVTFKPCGHQTCRNCIERHLLNTRECFFCKVTIDQVEDLSGNALYNFIDENLNSSELS
ncbi:E3 ubiquitin-protein ligase RNF123-like [Hylaeus volcanicus]|uniref:E3 ubiquitin-protein ligase RNF123-like n=1 Tax=Hylaeus volcanicus TaxID=313075 RepID=UPI0023B7E486|nr:E3 ubiquitin-protein ligase RNF123-like [Hylaeus volcanicus]